MKQVIKDKNGTITNILFQPVEHVAVIESPKGAVRSNHWHKKSWHFLYVLSGRMEYAERKLDGSDRKVLIVGPGEMVFTGPNLVHRTTFLEDTVMLSLTNNASQENHEEDLVKEEF